jgi:MFS family permease
MKRFYPSVIFIILLAGISVFYNYHEIAFKRPQSIHRWRQCDCASIALNYSQGGMKFFSPETHNLTADGGTSGKNCTSEIPLLYYTVGFLYKIFGYHEYIYRIFNTLLFFLGLFFLYKLLQYLLKDLLWALILTFLFFTSPVLVYYGNNFLSNSSSLAFAIAGWYYFTRFFSEHKNKLFYISVIFLLLAGAFRVTALFSAFAVAGLFTLELTGIVKFNPDRKIFFRPAWNVLAIISVFLLIGLWVVYASNYNHKHDSTYFSTTILPIWGLDRAGIKHVLDNIRKVWINQYFNISVLLFLAACFLFIIFNFRKNNKLLIYSIIIIFLEAVVYIITQFRMFADHDYYLIEIYILPILIVICTFDLLKRHFPGIFNSLVSKGVIFCLLLFNIYYARQKMNERYTGWMNNYLKNKDIYTITPYLRQIGITPFDTVISIPDDSHASLYLMNQKGWTEFTDERLFRDNRIQYNRDSSGIQSSIDKGARYLILNGIGELFSKTYLRSYCTNLIGNYNNVLIFDLKNKEKNFQIEQRTIDKTYACDAELVSDDRKNFISPADSTFFQYGSSQSDVFAHRGKYSARLDANLPYGMTIRFKNLENGESFAITVWRKTINETKGALIASGSPYPYYNNEYRILETDPAGWEKLFMGFFIPAELAGQELAVYVYNPDKDPVYFDDLEITRYKSILNVLNQSQSIKTEDSDQL